MRRIRLRLNGARSSSRSSRFRKYVMASRASSNPLIVERGALLSGACALRGLGVVLSAGAFKIFVALICQAPVRESRALILPARGCWTTQHLHSDWRKLPPRDPSVARELSLDTGHPASPTPRASLVESTCRDRARESDPLAAKDSSDSR